MTQFHDTDDARARKAAENLLPLAMSRLERHGRFWHASIARRAARALREQLREQGYPVNVCEIGPEWEHVFYTDGSRYRKLLAIARERARIRNARLQWP